jgi:hypothetical protein
MHTLTRIAYLLAFLSLGLIAGCGGDGDNGGTPPTNQPPTVAITSTTPDSIYYNEEIEFTWQGNDPDGSIATYHAGLDGDLQPTMATSASYSGAFEPGESHTFTVVAEDNEGAQSTPASVDFGIYTGQPEVTLTAYGEGVTDSDGDGFWSEFNVRWAPDLASGSAVEMYLRILVRPTYGSGGEIELLSDNVIRNPQDEDTLTYTLPLFVKNLYDMRLELHDTTDSTLAVIDYDSLTSLSQVGLEQFDGFNAWFDDAWMDNGIDANNDDYFEFIDLWWDVDASLDRGRVKVVIFERDSANVEDWLYEFFPYEVEGLGDEDANAITITAGTTFGEYDYRLELFDEFNNLLDELDYGEDPDLMDIPMGNIGGPGIYNRATGLNQ